MTLAYTRKGSGRQSVLCVTGLGGHADFWSELGDSLADDFNVISFDQRGCGVNRGAEGRHTLDEIAADALGILDDAGVDRAIVIGHSMGGVVTQGLVIDHPERFEAAVFSGTFCVFDWYMMAVGDLRQQLLDGGGAAGFGQLSALLAMPASDVADRAYDLRGRLAQVTPRMPDAVMMKRMQAPYGFDRREELRQLALPAMVIGASDDLLAPIYQSRLIADLIPDARLEVVDGGHFFPKTRPGVYREKVGAFLRSLSPAVSPATSA
ncbi:alpha/beta fold hydrolase [Sphingopyxis terrae]|uniref:alpha/beta fold hydrolase n=1 Tax=Sphingopyxis terrae TaxID=33052 RepID=UPI002A17B942|nr:alpha/beta hydrolase [Sphingopyxis terrae]MDX8356483.1 alpha/beta hydrolase [Sphingopyxis terrae]